MPKDDSAMLVSLVMSILARDVEQLPAPTGPHSTGTLTFHWIDPERSEGGTPDPGDLRELEVQIWYPARPAADADKAPHNAEIDAFADVYPAQAIERIAKLRTNSVVGAPRVGDARPVVLISHGWQANRRDYTITAEHIASVGYVVVGVDHAFLGPVLLRSGEISKPSEEHFDGQNAVVDCYATDQRFVLDRLTELNAEHEILKGGLDLERITTVGHSSGVHAAAGASRTDARIGACVLIDAFGNNDDYVMRQPLLVLRTARAPKPDATYLARARGAVYDATLREGTHTSCMDAEVLWAQSDAARDRALTKLRAMATLIVAFCEQSFSDGGENAMADFESEWIEVRRVDDSALGR